jgi:hypothetical protein
VYVTSLVAFMPMSKELYWVEPSRNSHELLAFEKSAPIIAAAALLSFVDRSICCKCCDSSTARAGESAAAVIVANIRNAIQRMKIPRSSGCSSFNAAAKSSEAAPVLI